MGARAEIQRAVAQHELPRIRGVRKRKGAAATHADTLELRKSLRIEVRAPTPNPAAYAQRRQPVVFLYAILTQRTQGKTSISIVLSSLGSRVQGDEANFAC